MKIERMGFKPIRKKPISLNNLISFEKINIDKLETLLNDVISHYTYNTFDLLKLVMSNYDGNLKEAIERIDDYSDVRFNCYYACKLLKEKLNDIGLKSYLISYKSVGFSLNKGDEIIKEAHMALVIPTIKEKKVFYILLDPGLRIPKCITFYKDDAETNIIIDNDEITIKKCNDSLYSHTMIMQGYNRYSENSNSYFCQEYFDINDELNNPIDVLFPVSLYVLFGYRVIRFNVQKNNQAFIKLMLVDECIEIKNNQEYKKISFSELASMSDINLRMEIKKVTQILKIDDYEFMRLIRFVLMIKDELKRIVLDTTL